MDSDERLVGTEHGSTVYRWFERAAQRRLEATGDKGWQYVGPHDLRRSWGRHILERGVIASVVMEWGGWNDWETFRDHYLSEFSPEALRRERQKVGFLADTVPERDDAQSEGGFLGRQPPGSDGENQYAE
jgi:integrase